MLPEGRFNRISRGRERAVGKYPGWGWGPGGGEGVGRWMGQYCWDLRGLGGLFPVWLRGGVVLGCEGVAGQVKK